MTPNTIIERLRGIVRVPVNDGAGLLDGKDFFERTFPTSQLAKDAADRIEELAEVAQFIVDNPDSNGPVAVAKARAALDKINAHRE
jgi:hypothetical protein